MARTFFSRARAWGELLRLPNLLTVPGDPAVGFLLTAGVGGSSVSRLLAAMWTALCLYAAGLILNDLMDHEVDLRERPGRPIPSGRIPARQAALALALAFYGATLPLPFLPAVSRWAALALALTVIAYDVFAKRSAWMGPPAMGLCRALSVMLGAAFAQPFGAWPWTVYAAAGVMGCYVAGVTLAARNEASLLETRPRLIGLLLSGLLPLQAVLALAAQAGARGLIVAATLLLLLPANRALGRRFAAS